MMVISHERKLTFIHVQLTYSVCVSGVQQRGSVTTYSLSDKPEKQLIKLHKLFVRILRLCIIYRLLWSHLTSLQCLHLRTQHVPPLTQVFLVPFL